jgi:LuxR family maltose regulon positive regulatory protein
VSELGTQAVSLAERHGWSDQPLAGTGYLALAAVLVWQGRPDEAETPLRQAERTLRAETEPAAAQATYYIRGMVELARGQDANALAAFRSGERRAGLLAQPDLVVTAMHAFTVQALVRLGDTESAGRDIAARNGQDREGGEMRVAAAVLRLAQDDPRAASAALAPVLDGSRPIVWTMLRIQVFLLEAIARDALGDSGAAHRALERALDLAEPNGELLWFLLHPAPDLLERHTGQRTAHRALLAEIQSLLAGGQRATYPAEPPPLSEPLSDGELRVLRYLPTNLTAPEIAAELSISRHTVKTHMRHLYAKLGAHRRAQAVAHARDRGLLAPGRRSTG